MYSCANIRVRVRVRVRGWRTERPVTGPRFGSVSLLHDGTPASSHCQPNFRVKGKGWKGGRVKGGRVKGEGWEGEGWRVEGWRVKG